MTIRAAAIVLILATVILAGGAAVKHTWPMSKEQRAELRKMDRPAREAWFKDLELPRYEVKRRTGEIKLDGVLDEPAWKEANVVSLVEAELGGPVHYGTRVRALWDDEALYVAFECDDPDVHAPRTGHDDDLWKHDVVELFIDPDADEKSYVEIHVAANGATADYLWADFRPETDWFTTPPWQRFNDKSAATSYEPKGIASAVKVDGTLNNPADTDKGWTVEWRIPYSALVNVVPDEQRGRKLIDCRLFKQVPIEVPKAGATWRMNFCRCDDSLKLTEKDARGRTVNVEEYSNWAPVTGSNHMPFLFGHVTFVK